MMHRVVYGMMHGMVNRVMNRMMYGTMMYRVVHRMMYRRMMLLCAGKGAQADQKGKCKQNLLHDVLFVLVY
jgi:hypothetical protein